VGAPLLVFGAVHPASVDPSVAPEELEREPANNYRRWWNNSWATVEAGGPGKAGKWSDATEDRVRRMVQHAHRQGLWIRFYTLDGATPQQQKENGWFKTYSFSSLEEAKIRWQVAIKAGVDYLATDQYEQFNELKHSIEGREAVTSATVR
jgi:glycerophosphoryl diester phosphodiesterase